MLFGICAFTSLFIGTDLLRVVTIAMDVGAPLSKVGKLVLLQMPQVIVWTFPMAVLLSVLLALSRLSSTSEIVAMRTGGLSFYRIVAPVLIVGIVMTGLTLCKRSVVPKANLAYKVTMAEMGADLAIQDVIPKVQGNLLEWFLYAARFDSQLQTMEDVTMVTLDKNRPRRPPMHQITWTFWLVYGERGYILCKLVSRTRFAWDDIPVDIGQKPRDILPLRKLPMR